MNKQNKAKIATTCVAFVLSISAVFAVETTLPTPPPSEYADTESRIDFAVTNWPGLGRHIKLWLSAVTTPSNNVQIAFGRDANADGTLAPHEIQIVAGFDCGFWFVRDERDNPARSLVVEDWADADSQLTNQQTKVIHLRQVSSVSNRFDFAQVTTRGRGESAAQIAAEIFRLGTALFLR